MIIDCVNCSKKFEVNATLIPENGRTIQCGSCNHVWFYKPKIEQSNNEISSPKSNEDILENKKTKLSVSKFLSYFLVILITFIALIIVLDTFKSPLSSIFPGLEIFLYNFFETLKDLHLFIKNLFS